MELIRTAQPEVADLIEQALTRNGITVERHQVGEFLVLSVPDRNQYASAHRLVEELVRDLKNRQGKVAVEPLTGRPQPLLSGGWLASMGWVTRSGLVLCAVIYLTPFLVGEEVYRALMFPPALEGLASQPWRLFTPMLLHFSVLHILFNLLWWADLGRLIERFQSSTQLLMITLVTAAVSNVAQFLHTGPMFGGLSGVVYGLLGYLWIYGRVNPGAGYPLRPEIVLFMLAWLVICFVGLSDVVANAAHLAGLVSGCVLGGIFGLIRRGSANGAV